MAVHREAGLEWVKSSRNVGTGACIELASNGDMIVLRDSKNPDVHLAYTRAEITAFIYGAKSGEFDHLINAYSPVDGAEGHDTIQST
jgi:hypothetical protein